MFVLLESSNREFIEHLHMRLSICGINCLLSELGTTADGQAHFAIQLPIYSQMANARTLLYRSQLFAMGLSPEFRDALNELRQQPHNQLLHWLTSPWALRISAIFLALVVLDYIAAALLK